MHACTHVSPPWRWAWQEGEWGRREEEGSCPYFDFHLDLQVGPVDREQRAVRAGGAQLPGTVGHVPVAVSQEDQRGEGDLAGEIAFVFCVSQKDHTSLVVVGKVCHPNSDPLLHCHQPLMGCPRYTR